ncbi:MerR family DNA-binding transcriptional regulator [Streptomyces sp. NPDC006798]|uniref:MerR family DNA-binding transcriptional regulator n=1 Tax=Streptomyces sp. NPDC006798 TaxID=3155462 RepID=UPI003405A077
MGTGELSRLTGVSVRAPRYYEEKGLIRPVRPGNGYRDSCEGADEVVRQIRGLIDCGLPTRIIRGILPYLDGPADPLPPVPCAQMPAQVAAEREQLDRRIHCLVRNRNALDDCLKAVRGAAGNRA